VCIAVMLLRYVARFRGRHREDALAACAAAARAGKRVVQVRGRAIPTAIAFAVGYAGGG